MIQITAQIDNELAQFAGRQAPFAASLALNRTAIGARDLVRANLPKRFKLRNSWTERGVQAKMSTKANLLAQVGAPGYLGIHETGGTMQPTTSSLLAAKMPGVTRNQIRRRDRTFRMQEDDGHAAIYKRVGRKQRRIKMLAWLSPEHDFDERLHMEDDVTEHVRQRFAHNFQQAVSDAMR